MHKGPSGVRGAQKEFEGLRRSSANFTLSGLWEFWGARGLGFEICLVWGRLLKLGRLSEPVLMT